IWADGNTTDISDRSISFGDSNVTFDVRGNNVTLANSFGDPFFEGPLGGLEKKGTGTLALDDILGFAGASTITEGTLRLGGEVDFVAHLAGITNNGTLELALTATGPELPASVDTVISGTGNLIHSGNDSTEIYSANTFSGITDISAGTLILRNPLALQNSTLNLDSFFSGELDISQLGSVTLGALQGDKNISLTSNIAEVEGAVNLTVGGNGATTTYDGSLSGLGSFSKFGAGVMTLTGEHNYTGGTTVNNGTGGGALELTYGAS